MEDANLRSEKTVTVKVSATSMRWRGAQAAPELRELAEETAIALVHDGTTTAVMMATPADLEDFAIGFALTEGIVANPSQIRDLEVVREEAGIEVRAWLAAGAGARLAARRRRLAGPTGCGLCGVESLAEAVRDPPRVRTGLKLSAADMGAALSALSVGQTLGVATRAVHAAAWWSREGGLEALREDVGRHNALDKTVGALARSASAPPVGAVVLTSRVSVEMVQKAAVAGAQVLIAVSAPTALALRVARDAGMTLVAIARADGFEVFTHHERITA